MKKIPLTCLPIVMALIAGNAPAQDESREYPCNWTTEKITIDGLADEAAWKAAKPIDQFGMAWAKEPREPETKTVARLLWDRDFLYFFAEMEDSDLYADETEHDGDLWLNDVFELFFKPSPKHPGYYEFEFNPNGAILDMFLPRRAAGGLKRFIREQDFHIDVKVNLKGTLNQWADQDEGWTVEGRIPWTDFHKTGGRPKPDEVWTFHAARYDYSVDLEHGVDSTSSALLSKYNFHYHEDYDPIRFIGPSDDQALVLPERFRKFGPVSLPALAGSPEPPPIYRAEPVFPDADINFLVTMEYEPHQGLLYLGDRPESYKHGNLKRLNLETGEVETLLERHEYINYDIAFHPDFATNGFIFLGRNGPESSPRHERFSEVTRYTINPQSGDLEPESELRIISWKSGGHDGAALEFDSDGHLFITSGDGSNDSDTNLQGQGLDHLRSKVLRINVDRADGGRPYSVPADNPFVSMSGARPETWAYGMRNPWRMTWDAKRGQLWVGNNGQDWLEQVYLVQRGANYGWSVYEGSRPFRAGRKRGPTPISPPTLEHGHHESRSLTGGVVYSGSQLAEIDGAYVYGDHSTGKIWAARHDGTAVTWNQEIADTALAISDFETLPDGRLLVADWREGGGIYRLAPNDAPDTSAEFPTKLSQTGLFVSAPDHAVDPSLLPYSVNVPHWADGADSERFLALPASAGEPPLGFTMADTWKIPSGSTFLQTLSLNGRRIESRILTQRENEWVGYSYRWNAEQTDATLVDAEGADADIGGQTWRFPARAECMICHTRAAGFVLGLQTAQLNRPHEYGHDFSANQLEVLESLGWLRTNWAADTRAVAQQKYGAKRSRAVEDQDFELVDELERAWKRKIATRGQRSAPGSQLLSFSSAQLPKMAPVGDSAAPLELRARSYLAANCSHCHRGAGGGNSPFDLRFVLEPEEMLILDAPPRHGFAGLTEQNASVVSTSRSKTSVLLTRVAMRGSGQMPPLGSNVPDMEGFAVLGQWIAGLQRN